MDDHEVIAQGDGAAARLAEPLERELAEVVRGYRLALMGNKYRGLSGQRRGVGVGSSLEFHDFRDYAPGDDVRHVDWRSYARSDQLRVRLHEAEVAPIVEVLVDTSASMASTEAKLRAVRGLVLSLQAWSLGAGSSVRILALGGSAMDAEIFADDSFACAGAVEPQLPVDPMRAGGVRVLLTDALWAEDPMPLLSRCSAGASRFVCLQLLDPWERRPTPGESMTLVDCETNTRRTLRLDGRTVRAYCERLDRLCAGLQEGVVRLGGLHVPITADRLATICRRDLAPRHIVVPT